MKTAATNPFHDLFVTDSAPAEDFVRYFSPFLVPHVTELFTEGNVVLIGTQGCGKSMLLKLFQPEIRVAYAVRSNECKAAGKSGLDFPVPSDLRNFIGAGVNLSKSGILDLAQMMSPAPDEAEYQNFAALFGDLLNYWLLRDLIKSILYIANNASVFGGLVCPERYERFVEIVRDQDCWFGYLEGCNDWSALEKRVNERVVAYRRWHARNDDHLSNEILRSKTAIGEPLARTVECLKEAGVIGRDVRVFLRIDQLEELWHKEGTQALLGQYFRHVINRVIGNRDLRVSFRVGTRRYGWDVDLAMPGGRKIEEFRDYLQVDLDRRLRRQEDRAGWLFDGFAEDVFLHRVSAEPRSGFFGGEKPFTNLAQFLGHSPTPQEIIERLVVSPPEDPRKLLRLDDDWRDDWIDYILKVYRTSPKKKNKDATEYPKDVLGAALVVAWGLQNGGKRGAPARREGPPPTAFPPWTEWWKKERLMIAVMQMVVRHQQTLFWWGTEKALALSASNITIFLSICREVWDQRQRRLAVSEEDARMAKGSAEPIAGWKIQAVAIDTVSKDWHRNFGRQPGRPAGDVRMRFVDEVGGWLRQKMLSDSSMSYPGGNGFSLKQSDLDDFPQLSRLLAEAVGWGDLYEVDHTTKVAQEKHRDPRKKYYLNPILSPHFQIPEAHTKEPLYEPVGTIIELAIRARAIVQEQRQLSLDRSP